MHIASPETLPGLSLTPEPLDKGVSINMPFAQFNCVYSFRVIDNQLELEFE